MLTTPLIHPQILTALASCGHGSLLLVADGNYPVSTTRGPNACVVNLNLIRGTVDAATVAAALVQAVPIEAAFVMAPTPQGQYAMAGDPPIWTQFTELLRASGRPLTLEPIPRAAFYDLVATPQVAVVVVTGEIELYGNLLLRVGVVADPLP